MKSKNENLSPKQVETRFGEIQLKEKIIIWQSALSEACFSTKGNISNNLKVRNLDISLDLLMVYDVGNRPFEHIKYQQIRDIYKILVILAYCTNIIGSTDFEKLKLKT